MRQPFRLVPAIVLFVVAAPMLSVCAAPPDKEIKALEGAWVMRAMEVDGGKIEESEGGEAVQLFLNGNKYISKVGQTVIEQGTIAIDPGKSPATIDLIPDSGLEKGQVRPGIYWIRGDSLAICLATPPVARPTEFSAQKGDSRILIIYKRARPK